MVKIKRNPAASKFWESTIRIVERDKIKKAMLSIFERFDIEEQKKIVNDLKLRSLLK